MSEPLCLATEKPAAPAHWLVLLRGIAGAGVGGVLGYLVFRWLASYGMQGHAIPGALLGLGAGLAARGRSRALAVGCAAASLLLIILAEWLRAPFLKDPSLAYFVGHLHQLNGAPVKFVMMGIGAVCAYWFAQGK